jgi:ankyrin repeat protein
MTNHPHPRSSGKALLAGKTLLYHALLLAPFLALPGYMDPPNQKTIDRMILFGKGNHASFLRLCNATPNPNMLLPGGRTLLPYVAGTLLSEPATKALLSRHVDPNILDAHGHTALSRLVSVNSHVYDYDGFHEKPAENLAAIASALLAAGADPNRPIPGTDKSALLVALDNSPDSVVDELLKHGARFGSEAEAKETLLRFARERLPEDLLIRQCRSQLKTLNFHFADGSTPLIEALPNPPLLEALLADGADPNLPDVNDLAPLAHLVLHPTRNSSHAAELLLRSGADVAATIPSKAVYSSSYEFPPVSPMTALLESRVLSDWPSYRRGGWRDSEAIQAHVALLNILLKYGAVIDDGVRPTAKWLGYGDIKPHSESQPPREDK